MTNVARQIEHWFAAHDDGEFTRFPRTAPYTLVAPLTGERLIYTTKPRTIVEAISRLEPTPGMGLVGRSGLPGPDDVAWISRLAEGCPLGFLGDLDPPDLLVFAWLRAELGPERIQFAGIRDELLSAASFAARSPERIALSASEVEALPLVDQLFPDLGALVGPRCEALLRGGEKVELEGLVHWHAEEFARLVRTADPT